MITLILLLVAGMLNGAMDDTIFHHLTDSWRNKYKSPLVHITDLTLPWYARLYYKLAGLYYQERFPLSGTLLVFLTDTWHGYQFGFMLTITAAIMLFIPIFPSPVVDFLALSAVFHITKQITLTVLRSKL